MLYLNERARDPRMTRKQREMPTTAVLLQIGEPWFSGAAGEAWRARRQIAQALRMHLAYQQSIALPDLGCQVENIILETDRGFLELQDAILVHDNIHGGMGLVQDLYENIDRYVPKPQRGHEQRARERSTPSTPWSWRSGWRGTRRAPGRPLRLRGETTGGG